MSEALWVVGVILNIAGSISVNAGTNLLKLSLKLQDEIANDSSKSIHAPSRVLGATLFVIGSLTNFVSFGLAAQSLLASLGGVQFVANIVFGKVILNETVTSRHLIASIILVAGVVIAVSFSNHESTMYALEEIVGLYDLDYAIFMVGIIITAIVSESLFRLYKWREDLVLSRIGSSISMNLFPFHHFVKPLTFCWVSACFGTQSVLQAKCIAEIGKIAILKDDFKLLLQKEVLIMLLAFFFFLASWLKRLMMALSMYDGLLIIPILQVCWTISAVIQGSIFFKEFSSASQHQIEWFTSGLTLVVLGVYILAGSESTTSTPPRSQTKIKMETNNPTLPMYEPIK